PALAMLPVPTRRSSDLLARARSRLLRARLDHDARLAHLLVKHVVDLESEALSLLGGEDEALSLRAHDGQLFHPAPLRRVRTGRSSEEHTSGLQSRSDLV